MGARGYGGGAQRSERGSWLLFLGRGLLGGLRDFNWFDFHFDFKFNDLTILYLRILYR